MISSGGFLSEQRICIPVCEYISVTLARQRGYEEMRSPSEATNRLLPSTEMIAGESKNISRSRDRKTQNIPLDNWYGNILMSEGVTDIMLLRGTLISMAFRHKSSHAAWSVDCDTCQVLWPPLISKKSSILMSLWRCNNIGSGLTGSIREPDTVTRTTWLVMIDPNMPRTTEQALT